MMYVARFGAGQRYTLDVSSAKAILAVSFPLIGSAVLTVGSLSDHGCTATG